MPIDLWLNYHQNFVAERYNTEKNIVKTAGNDEIVVPCDNCNS